MFLCKGKSKHAPAKTARADDACLAARGTAPWRFSGLLRIALSRHGARPPEQLVTVYVRARALRDPCCGGGSALKNPMIFPLLQICNHGKVEALA
jgi:hypothetical protein